MGSLEQTVHRRPVLETAMGVVSVIAPQVNVYAHLLSLVQTVCLLSVLLTALGMGHATQEQANAPVTCLTSELGVTS
jgi:flagellar biosynthesis protein FliR